MPADAKRVQSAFLAVIPFTDGAERAAALDRQCGDDAELRRRVLALVAAHDLSAELPPAGGPPLDATTNPPALHHPGLAIAGRYKLLEQIGEGGMGAVWVAEQSEPVRRRVALKLIKPGMDTKQVLSRFAAERQALALMDHPNIAKVYDGGMTEEGRPYFVMEYVKGVPITDYCDQAKLSIDERLKLFLPICQAVQHAHQKGIIHRDLKPSNLLVCLYDGQPVPKVIDFGLAKAISQPLTEHTLYTAHGLMVGTPLYMSPEQAEFNNLDVDTRTDIYSLGVILYELLTGTTPLEKQKFKDAAFQEILRLIKEEEPPKPSTKLSGSASLPAIAAQRGLEPAQLSRVVRGELDWIVMKSLEKERSRRYATANALAEDVRRYLEDEAIVARPASSAYRLKKFVQRNCVAVGAFSAIAAALLLGTTISTWLAVRESRASRLARASLADAEAQRKLAFSAKEDAERQRDRAEKAKLEESKQLEIAKAQEAEAKAARQAESAQRATAEQERDKATALTAAIEQQKEQQRRLLYVAQMNLIRKAWDANQVQRVRELLNATRPQAGEEDLRGFEWHYWMRQLHGEERALQLPIEFERRDRYSASTRPTGVIAAAFSADGRLVGTVIYSDKWRINVWDTETGKRLFDREWKYESLLHEPPIPAVVSRRFYGQATIGCVDADKIAVIFSAPNTTVGGPGTPIPRTARPGAARLIVFRLAGNEQPLVRDADGLSSTIDTFVFSQNGARFATALPEKVVQVCSTDTGDEVARVAVPTREDAPSTALFLALSPDGKRLALKPAVQLGDAAPFGITIAELETGKTIETERLPAQRIAFSLDGSQLLAGVLSPDATNEVRARLFDATTGAEMHQLVIPHLDLTRGVQANPLDKLEVSPTADRLTLASPGPGGNATLDVWNVSSGKLMQKLQGHATNPVALRFSADGSRLLSVHEDGWMFVRFLKAESPKTVDSARSAAARVGGFASTNTPRGADVARNVTSPDGRWIVANLAERASAAQRPTSGGELRLTDSTGKVGERMLRAPQITSPPRFSPNSAYLLAFGFDLQADLASAGELKVWDVAAGREIISQRMPAIELPASSFARGEQGDTGSVLPRRALPIGSAIAFSPDSRWLAVGVANAGQSPLSQPSIIHLWDLATGERLLPTAESRPTVDPLHRLSFSASGEVLLSMPSPSISYNGPDRLTRTTISGTPFQPGVQAWSVPTGKPLLMDKSAVLTLASSDGGRIAGLAINVEARSQPVRDAVVWHTQTGQELCRTRLPASATFSGFAFSSDGRRIAMATGSDVQVYDVDAKRELFSLQGHAGSVRAIAFNADSSRIVTSAGAGQLNRPNGMAGTGVLFTAAMDESRETKIWDGATGQELLSLSGVVNARISQFFIGDEGLELLGRSLRIAEGPTWDAAELPARTEAEEVSQWLAAAESSSSLPSLEQIAERLQREPSLSDDVRKQALELIRKRRNPKALMEMVAAIARNAALPRKEYERSHALILEATANSPASPECIHLDALIQYRLEDYAAAGAAGERGKQILAGLGREPLAEDLTLTAMTLFQCGQREAALQALETARLRLSYNEVYWRILLAEAERTLAIPTADADPGRWIGRSFMPRASVQVTDAAGAVVNEWQFPFLVTRVDKDRLGFGKLFVARTEVVPLEHAPGYYTQALQLALTLTPSGKARLLNDRGAAWRSLGELDKAIEDYTAAIQANVDYAYAYSNRGEAYNNEKKDYAKALADYDAAIRLDPATPTFHLKRASALRKQGQFDAAIQSCDEAIRLKPGLGYAYCVRAKAWAAKGDKTKMLADFEEGIRRDPADPEVWTYRAWLLATSQNAEQRDGKQAVADATKACELVDWKGAIELDALAAAHAETGDFASAIKWQEAALSLVTKKDQAEYEARLALYRKGKPYREPLVPATVLPCSSEDP